MGQNNFYSLDQEKRSCISSYLIPINKKNYPCLTDSQYYKWLFKKYFCLHLSQSEHQQAIVKRLTSSFGWVTSWLTSWVTSLNLRNYHIFESQNSRTKTFGLDSIAYRASQLWKNVPEEFRNSTSHPVFMEKIKKASLTSCYCNSCRKYIHHVEFI